MIHAARGLADAALDLLYPPHCLACGTALRAGGWGVCCPACAEAIAWIGADRCRRCGGPVAEGLGAADGCPACHSHPPAYVEQACALAPYEEPLRDVLLALKFGAGLRASDWLGEHLAMRIFETELLKDIEGPVALVPVPLVRRDLGRRGFNQAEAIARAAAGVLKAGRRKVSVEPGLLRKVRATAPQALLNREARRANLAGAFAADPARAEAFLKGGGGGVVLVDDVMTTGSTVGECARTLHGVGLKVLRAAVVARG